MIKVKVTYSSVSNPSLNYEGILDIEEKDKYGAFSFPVVRANVDSIVSKRLAWDYLDISKLCIEVL